MKSKVLLLIVFTAASFAAPLASADMAVDDCAFIREQILKLSEAGGVIQIAPGMYTCQAPIVIDQSDITLLGEGEVTLRLGNNINSPVIVMGDAETPPRPLKNIQVLNLKIDGNRWHQKFECWGGPCDSGGTSFIRNNGITVRAVTKGRIKDVYITGARSGGVVTEKGCYDLVIDNLTAVDNEFDGFAGYETIGSRLTRLNLSHNRAAGISLDIRFHGNFFKDIRMESNGDVGIFMRDSNSNIFEDVTIADSGSHGVFLAQADGMATCSMDNEFQNLTVLHSRGIGFRLNDICEGNTLSGISHFAQNRDGCISEAPNAHLRMTGQLICLE